MPHTGSYYKNPRRFCPAGHDTSITGRTRTARTCNVCLKAYTKRVRSGKFRDKYRTYHRLYSRKYMPAYRKAHPEIYRVSDIKNHARRGLRVPAFGQEGIRQFYRDCPPGMVIDHIAPLQGALVSGLHVVWNLQYLTPEENAKKYNKFNPTISSRTGTVPSFSAIKLIDVPEREHNGAIN